MAETIGQVRNRIALAAERGGRTHEVRVVAVTKGHPAEAVAAARRAGLTAFGENRIQELESKRAEVGRSDAEWHMIGHLQRNKARLGIQLFDWIHSVDSLRLAHTLSREAARAGIRVRALLQVNTSGEETKGGFEEAAVVDVLGEVGELEGIEIHGLMTMAPWTQDAAVLRHTFRRTRDLLERCAREVPRALTGRELSMGMSNDFEIAIEEGATIVRLGTVLFGEREHP